MHDPSNPPKKSRAGTSTDGDSTPKAIVNQEDVITYSMMMQCFGDSDTDDFIPSMVENDVDMIENDETVVDMVVEPTDSGESTIYVAQ